jgi:polysaccharide deacetylase 2 family uncharacterized protein YibQ
MGKRRKGAYHPGGKWLVLLALATIGFLGGMGLSALMERGEPPRKEVLPMPSPPEETPPRVPLEERGSTSSPRGTREGLSKEKGLPKGEPSQAHSPRISLIMDDLGWDKDVFERIVELGIPLTLSILPLERDSRWMAERAKRRGFEVMVHLPMEPQNGSGPPIRSSFLKTTMTTRELYTLAESMLDRIPQASGANNHMGSLFTEDPRGMELVAELLAKRKMYFVDSLTSPNSVAYEVAHRKGIRAYRRDVFLDVRRREDEIRTSFQNLVGIARKRGYALAICHPYPETLRVLAELHRESSLEGIKWTRVSELPETPEGLDQAKGELPPT